MANFLHRKSLRERISISHDKIKTYDKLCREPNVVETSNLLQRQAKLKLNPILLKNTQKKEIVSLTC